MLSLATSRDAAALTLLLELVATGGAADSTAAEQALRLYVHDEALQRQVQTALDRRRSASRRPRAP